MIRKQLRELRLQRRDLRPVAHQDVRIVGVEVRVVLVILLGGVEALERGDLGDDAAGKDVGGVELGDVLFADLLLLVIGIKDGRAVRRADIGPWRLSWWGRGRPRRRCAATGRR